MEREEQKEQRRQQILYTGLKLFVQKGYAATKISDIAQAAGMSVGLLFHYFESKEKLLEVLVTMGLEGTKMPMQMSFDNPLQFFESFTTVLFTTMREQPYMANMFVLMAQMQRTQGIPEEIRALAMQVNTIEQSVSIMEAGQKAGSIRQGNPLALASAFWCSIQGIAEQYALHPEVPMPEPEWITSIIRA